MRVPLVVSMLALGFVSLPATAAESGDDGALSAAGAELADPARQEQVGAMAGAMMEAVLQMPVGPMLRAAAEMSGEDAQDIDPGTTVADMAGDDAAAMPQEVARRVPQVMGAMAHMAGALEEMLPQLREMAATMREHLPAAE